MLVQCHAHGFRIAEITCPTRYFAEASSISFRRLVKYGFGCLWVGTNSCCTGFVLRLFNSFFRGSQSFHDERRCECASS